MAYTITLISNDVKSGKTTIAFNLATLIAKKNKKILLINQGYIPSLNLLKDLGKNITKKIITPFKLIECSQYLSVLLFSESKINPAKYDYLKLFSKQFQLLESKFDFIIIDSNHIWNTLTEMALIKSKKVIGIYDTATFSSNQLQNMLSFVRKNQAENQNLKMSTIILNNYNVNEHMSSLLEITKMINDDYLFITLPYRKELQKINEQSIKFVKNNQWDDYTLMLNKVVNQILKVPKHI